MEELNFAPLNLLLQASSKEIIVRLCNDAFTYRNALRFPDDLLAATTECLAVEKKDAKQLLVSLRSLLKNAVFRGSSEAGDVIALFPGDFHPNLRDLLAKVIIENLSVWKTYTVGNLVSLPKLVDFDWRVDIKTSSNTVSRMSMPTCFLQLKVVASPRLADEVVEPELINVELPKETLDTMLDGLGRIRDQLSAVAKTS